MLSPIPKARYSPSSSRPPMSRIITVRCHCCGPSDECSPNCATSSPIASIADQSYWTQSPSWAGGRSRSSPDPRPSGPSSQSLDDGSSNAPSLGSDATVALPRISRQASPAPRRGSWWQASACSLAASQGLEMTGIILSQTLRWHGPSTLAANSRRGQQACPSQKLESEFVVYTHGKEPP